MRTMCEYLCGVPHTSTARLFSCICWRVVNITGHVVTGWRIGIVKLTRNAMAWIHMVLRGSCSWRHAAWCPRSVNRPFLCPPLGLFVVSPPPLLSRALSRSLCVCAHARVCVCVCVALCACACVSLLLFFCRVLPIWLRIMCLCVHPYIRAIFGLHQALCKCSRVASVHRSIITCWFVLAPFFLKEREVFISKN